MKTDKVVRSRAASCISVVQWRVAARILSATFCSHVQRQLNQLKKHMFTNHRSLPCICTLVKRSFLYLHALPHRAGHLLVPHFPLTLSISQNIIDMAELGIATGVAGILSLGIAVCKGVLTYN